MPLENPSAKQNSAGPVVPVVAAISCGHLFNDIMQSMLPAIYPLLRKDYSLTFLQIGVITAVFQLTGSFLQPFIGYYTDKRPLPYSLPFSAAFTLFGLFILAFTKSYYILLLGAAAIGFGSSIFHPEGSRVARLAAGSRRALAQSIFQLGGNAGTALGPLLAALIIYNQKCISFLAPISLLALFVLLYVSKWYAAHLQAQRTQAFNAPAPPKAPLNKRKVAWAFFILICLMFSKYIYLSSMQNYYTFYTMEKFHLTFRHAQFLLFLYLGSIALGTILGGPIGDRIGTRSVIWISMIGILPFTLALPFSNLPVTALLTVIIGLLLASAFPAIVVFAQELIPGRVGTVAGSLFGLAFGIGAMAASVLGSIADAYGLQKLFIICSFLPVLGFIAIFLPKPQSHYHEVAVKKRK